MKELKERILAEGRNLGGGILDVSRFLNHQVEPPLLEAVGRALAARFKGAGVTKVVTAEVGGILPAYEVAKALGVPMIYARKTRPVTLGDCCVQTATSRTKRTTVELAVSREALGPDDCVLLADDFLATGDTSAALARLAAASGARLAGFAFVIEKKFEYGRERLARWGVPVESLVVITNMTEGKIIFK